MPSGTDPSEKRIRQIFRRKQVLRLDQLVELLDRSVPTVRWRLKEWKTHTSYNHNGRYYVLPEMADTVGIAKSSVSRNAMRISEQQLQAFAERRWEAVPILVNRSHLVIYPEKDRKNPVVIPAKGGDEEHKRNFLDCIRSRKETVCPPHVGHEANLPGLLAIISWRVGRSIKFDYKNEKIIGDPEASAFLTKKYREPWSLPKIG